MTIADAIRAMHTGRLGPRIVAGMTNGRLPSHRGAISSRRDARDLTERERDVLGGVAQGLGDKEIAANLGLSESTVKTHLKILYRRFNLRNRAHAAVFACARGLLKR